MLEGFGRAGAQIAKIALELGIVAMAIWLGAKVAERWNAWWGWAAGLGAVALGILLFSATLDSLDYARCKGVSDWQACMDDDGDGSE